MAAEVIPSVSKWLIILIGLVLLSGCTQQNTKSENSIDVVEESKAEILNTENGNIKNETNESLDNQLSEVVQDISDEDLGMNAHEVVVEETNSPEIAFTHLFFDPNLVSHITPLGELNGGYEEAQTIAGVMVNIKPEVVEGGSKEIEVRAPTDMTLEKYAYYIYRIFLTKRLVIFIYFFIYLFYIYSFIYLFIHSSVFRMPSSNEIFGSQSIRFFALSKLHKSFCISL